MLVWCKSVADVQHIGTTAVSAQCQRLQVVHCHLRNLLVGKRTFLEITVAVAA